jgi:IS5 family transposase
MLRDCYDPVDLFRLVPALAVVTDPVLMAMDPLLEDEVLFQQVTVDLLQRRPQTATTGRPSTPVEVILRMLVIKHLHGWSYEETEHFVSDSLVLRQFCRVYLHPVPDDTTLLRWANLIQPATLHQFLDRVAALAHQLRVTQGRKLRIDGTVVETNIHAPTDSSLLGDGLRVLSRGLKRAQHVLGTATQVAKDAFRDRRRSARQVLRQISDTLRQRGADATDRLQHSYQQLLHIAEATLDQVDTVIAALQHDASAAAAAIRQQLGDFAARTRQVIRQTRRRVLDGEQVPAGEKLVSLFEPHTAIIRKGPLPQATEYGRLVWLDEVDGGIISGYRVLPGNPSDTEQVQPSLTHHRQVFKHPPKLLAGDRGTWSAENEAAAQAAGVPQVVLPKPGYKSAARQQHERQSWFVRGMRWRAGQEGRISGLKRGQKLERCLYHGEAGMERWVGWGLIAHDLRQIGRVRVQRA